MSDKPVPPYTALLPTILCQQSAVILHWLKTERTTGNLPVEIVLGVLIELVSRHTQQDKPMDNSNNIINELIQAVEAYMSEATFPAWAGEDCRRCDAGTGDKTHSDTCEYYLAERRLEHWLGVAKSTPFYELELTLAHSLEVYKRAVKACRIFVPIRLVDREDGRPRYQGEERKAAYEALDAVDKLEGK